MIQKISNTFKSLLLLRPISPPSHQPGRGELLQLAVLIGITTIFHFGISHFAIGCYALIIYLKKILLIYLGKPAPPRSIMVLLTLVSLIMVLFLYGGWNGQRAGISFLVLLVCLKFLESRTLRDYFIVCLLLYFLAACSFLFDASISRIFLIILYTIAITFCLMKLSSPTQLSLTQSIKLTTGIILKALPLAIFLFFFFPRIQGTFGFIPSQDEARENELNDSLSAGDLASSAFNNSLAFRVEFNGDIPSYNQLYWRSKVMPIENNFSWIVKPINPNSFLTDEQKAKLLQSSQSNYEYTILHEKTRDYYLPYLDYVIQPSDGKLLPDFSVWHKKDKNSSFRYTGISQSQTYNPISANSVLLLQTQSQPSARLQRLLNQWKQQTTDPSLLVNLIYQYFQKNEFAYSLEPPILSENPVDDFIFNKKIGYCEHYASAFTILARWLGIPARVVVGYHGGELNQTGQFMEVRYSDAHAWSEVWINDSWVRVDPTAAISPDRINFGMSAFMSLWNGTNFDYSDTSKSLSNYLNPRGVSRLFSTLKDTWDNVEYQWNKWVVDYDFDKQKGLLTKLGLEHRNSLYALVMILVIGTVVIFLFYFWRLLPKPIKRSQAQKLYLKFVNRFKRFGIIKKQIDTPSMFAKKVTNHFPHLKDEIETITNTYVQMRYGRKPIELSVFKKQISEFKLTKTKNEAST